MAGSLCGLWVDDDGRVHTTVEAEGGGREDRFETLRPFAWLNAEPTETGTEGLTFEKLEGAGPFNWLAHANDRGSFERFVRATRVGASVDVIRPLESQFLLQQRQRLYRDLSFGRLRRCQLNIEVASPDGGFPMAARADDRVLAIGLRNGGANRLLQLDGMTAAAEKKLLEDFCAALREIDPDTIEGHNLFKFDLDYLRQRCRLHKVACAWGRYGQNATFRSSRLKVAERWIDFMRCDMPGRAVVDTYLLVQLFDITTRELTSFG
ncbi:MAG: 3'-5' exonuclease, partial [Opitutaceae bacterium]